MASNLSRAEPDGAGRSTAARTVLSHYRQGEVMNAFTSFAAATTAAAVLAIGLAGGATAAGHTPAAHDGVTGRAAAGTAPACIERTSVTNKPEGGVRVHLRNFCGRTMHVKVVVKNWSDSGCKSMPNGSGWLFQTVGGRYDRTVVC